LPSPSAEAGMIVGNVAAAQAPAAVFKNVRRFVLAVEVGIGLDGSGL